MAEDAAMETCPSPEIGDSRKRPLDTDPENEQTKRSHFSSGDSSYHMKILVPAVASGAIIGKGGETIASLQKDSGARVKMSKSHDFYPGTTERVCLITGSVDGIMSVMDFIMDKIREKPDLTTKIIDTDSKQNQDRDKQVKILVPNSTAGMIIGKGGAFIKQIKEESGSYVQISQKPKDISLQERCITIIGDKENNKAACKMILSKIVEDPQSGTCLNVSYADISGPVANFNPTGSPYATNQNAINTSTASLNSTLGQTIGGAASAAGLLVNGTGINLSLNLGSPNPAPNLAVATQLLEHIKIALRGSGYSETATNEVCAALGVLAKYGVLGMGVGVPHANGTTTLGSYLGVSALDQQTAAAASAATAGNVFGAVGQVNLDQYTAAAAAAAAAAASRSTQSQLEAAAAAQFDPFRHLGTTAATAAQAATPVSLNNNSFGLTAATGTTGTTAQSLTAAQHALSGLSKSPTPGDLGAKDTKNVEIPEVIVGAILVLLESLMRKTEVKYIYMLIRAKRNITAEERIKKILAGQLFTKVRKLKPNAHQLITPIHGDCAQPNLGISNEDRKILIANVDVVIHCAATIRFNEPLYDALLINVVAMRDLLEMAKEMRQLKSFVHISTAFSNCVLPHIEEHVHPEILGISARKTLEIATLLGPELTNSLTVNLVRSFPNTYTFTKALAEELILSERGNLPICIMRPGIITSTYAEPLPGWIDNFYGAVGTLMAVARGSLRVLFAHNHHPTFLVPVDFCANLILACGYSAGHVEDVDKKTVREPTVYNFVPTDGNQITQGELLRYTARYAKERPFSNLLWYPFVMAVGSVRLEKFLGILLHLLPAFIHDIWLRFQGKKTRTVRMFKKQEQFLSVLNYFKANVWTFDLANTQHLWNRLSTEDQVNFAFNMSAVNWQHYFRDMIFGLRQYLVAEEDATLPKALKRLQIFKWAHRSILILLAVGLLLCIRVIISYFK
ncbi:putative fatty acyl-CoA reductase CG5065 isoform X3 [Rhagoletis pomonella]|uniref:putative fatty acyl-CoA reductase CG5065 isoform X3 n=1 Tax=Rhagoletis pomonella TaxID=28610 RepID=UPI00177D2BA4|nr:putative fatty acyl-CoA reductase CG5065 isoform X3 [Rhagoletis pomonella]